MTRATESLSQRFSFSVGSPRTLLLQSVILLSLALSLCSCGRAPGASAPKLDSGLVFGLVKECLSFGPRPSGSEACKKHAEWIAARAKEYGAEVTMQEFESATPAGPLRFRNIIARVKGKGEGFVVVGSHFDTKSFPAGTNFVGANDAASSTGLLLAMIRAAASAKEMPPCALEFVFFDGEECMVSYGGNDGLHGSRHYVEELRLGGRLKACRAMLLLDMVGDHDLNITLPTGSPKMMAELLFRVADAQGARKHFGWHDTDILDDHKPFAEAGIPALDIIDFNYGTGNSYWHSSEDTLDKLSPVSLKIAGDAALGMLWEIMQIPRH